MPFGLSASNAIMSLARSLQNSGSDIVIEEDLANIFGRCRISPHREREFRDIVGKNHSSTLSSALGLTLEDGPGPTVSRNVCPKKRLDVLANDGCRFASRSFEG